MSGRDIISASGDDLVESRYMSAYGFVKPGDSSPGPIYELPSVFDDAAPAWRLARLPYLQVEMHCAPYGRSRR